MKIILLINSLLFTIVTMHANDNWIAIKSIDETKKQNIKLDVNLSQVEPINKIIKNVTVIKQLLDSSKKEKASSNSEKYWYALEYMENK